MEWLGNAIGGIAGLIGQPFQHRHEKRRDERQFRHAKEMSEYAYSKDLEQWERANLYNAPTQQMARLREAGLNPAMIYGSGGAKTQTATSLPKYQAPRPDYKYRAPIDPTAILSQYQDFRMKNAQIDLVKEQAKQAKAESRYANRYFQYRSTGQRATAQRQSYELGKELGAHTFTDATGYKYLMDDTPGMKAFRIKMERDLKAIDFMDSKKEMTDKQIEWYLWSNFGNMAIGAGKKLFSALGGAGKKLIGKLAPFKAGPYKGVGNFRQHRFY